MRLLPIRKISRQSKRLALFLTFCAGYVDAYTFIVRGNTLVAGQTGNVVFLSVELIKNNVSDVRDKVLTLLAFMMGVFLLYHSFKSSFTRFTATIYLFGKKTKKPENHLRLGH
ncbi:ABC transporter ATP-binding protein [Streptococcus pneumoniae]|nr:ABC transporter ATP-binding protein [Streptococcus pneumoniae]